MKNNHKTINEKILEDLVVFVNCSKNALSSDEDIRKLYADELIWLEERLDTWQRHEWRVALVGITSSGKSTLINALLGEDILPSRVKPSTNSFVLSRYGEKGIAFIHFNDGNKTEFDDVEEIKKHVKELTDEETNSGNKKGVKEIELYWPKFLFGEGVVLIDTPGLDAFRLESHEKMTMQMLHDLVDAVIFLTTAKANTDQTILGYLDIIADQNKPLLLVENMIDAIAPSLGDGCIEEKSREEVAKDHYGRLQKLLDKAGLSDKASVLQVSALWALQNRLSDSHVPELVNTVKKHLVDLEARILDNRYIQLLKELRRIVAKEQSIKSESSSYCVDLDMKNLENLQTKINLSFKGFEEDLNKAFQAAQKSKKEFSGDIDKISKTDVASARQIVEKVNNWLDHITKDISEIFNSFKKVFEKYYSNLNLTLEDMRSEMMRPYTKRLGDPVEYKEVIRRVEKDGLWSKFARWCGKKLDEEKWGYEEETRTIQEVRIDRFINDFNDISKIELDFLEKTIKYMIENRASEWLEKLNKEIRRRIESNRAKRTFLVEAEKRRAVANSIAEICNEIEKKTNIKLDSVLSNDKYAQVFQNEKYPEIEVPSYSLDFLKLAGFIARRRFIATRDAILERLDKNSARRALIWGFENDSLEKFMIKFWFDVFEPKQLQTNCFNIVKSKSVFDEIAFAYSKQDDGVEQLKSAQTFINKPAVVFLILDAMQTGSTQNQLASSQILSVLKKARGIVFVIQEIRSLENSDNITAGIKELLHISEDFKLRVDGVLVNDDRIVMTDLADRLFRKGDCLKTMADEKEWLEEFNKYSIRNKDKDVIANTIRNWRLKH